MPPLLRDLLGVAVDAASGLGDMGGRDGDDSFEEASYYVEGGLVLFWIPADGHVRYFAPAADVKIHVHEVVHEGEVDHGQAVIK